MKTIWKFVLVPLGDLNGYTIEAPGLGKILHADAQELHTRVVWAEVEPGSSVRRRKIHVVGTGQYVPEGTEHVNSYQSGPFVWHVYAGEIE